MSLQEKAVLLRELYHRTKNNMQVISSMLSMQSMETEDPALKAVCREIGNRIHSMSMVHHKLYSSKNLARIDLKEYIAELAELLFKSFKMHDGRIALELDCDKVSILLEKAIPLGLVINELVTNSLKNAFPGDRPGKIIIRVKISEGDTLVLTMADDGIGMPSGFDVSKNGKKGFQLVQAIVGLQLRGEMTVKTEGGFEFIVTFNDIFLTLFFQILKYNA